MKQKILHEICSVCGGVGQIPTGVCLKQKRQSMGVKQKDMAKRLGISQTYICDLEHGKRRATPQIVKGYGL